MENAHVFLDADGRHIINFFRPFGVFIAIKHVESKELSFYLRTKKLLFDFDSFQVIRFSFLKW